MTNKKKGIDGEVGQRVAHLAAHLGEVVKPAMSTAAGFEKHASVLHALVLSSPDHFYLYDRAGRHVYASPAAALALNIKQQDFIGKTWQELGFSTEVTERFDAERGNVFESGHHWRGEMKFPTDLGKSSSSHEYILSPVRADDGSVEAVLVTARDITERKQVEAKMQYQALHDVLTGLANRTLLDDRLEQGLLAAHRSASPLSLLFLDLDHFKEVNDNIGHHGGDLLLQQLALRWSGTLRASDTLSRLGGDEFVIVLPVSDRDGANEIVGRLRAEMDQVFDIEGQAVRVEVSIGMAVHAGGDEDGNMLMRQADQAMYREKQEKAHT